MYTFRGRIAEMLGVNAAVVAEYLYAGEEPLPEKKFAGKTWCRCSLKLITVDNPFLSIDQAKYAIKLLRDNKIIISKRITKGEFDHTNWYAFTEYGEGLMEGSESI